MVAPTTRRWLVAILLVATILRVGWCVYAARPPARVTPTGGVSLHDPNFYMYLGDRIAHGDGYRIPDGTPSAYYPVGYPAVLSVLFYVTDRTIGEHDVGAMAALNIVCGVATVAFVFGIGRRVAGDRTGLVAAAITALYPNLIFHTAVALTETLYNALLTGLVLVIVSAPWAERRFERMRLLTVAVLVGVCTLVRPVTLPIIAVLALTWWLFGYGWRRTLAYTGVLVAIAGVVVSPWIVRNAVTMHSAVLSTNTGDNLCMSRRVGGTGTFELPNPRCFSGPFDGETRPALEVDRDAYGRRLALEFVKDHPGEEVRLWGRRLYHTFKSDFDGLDAAESYGDDVFLRPRVRDLLSRVASDYFDLTVVLSIVAVPIALRRKDARWFLVVLVVPATVLLPVLATFGDTRFHVPALPFFALMAAVPIVAVADRRAPRA